ncbi:TetR-like C-terminal domain-containing protein [uncultured Pseudoflavonifractor sp.]|uniref:TetR/AcrR family transcriptional regulator n=1 Tax=uncultured Pseudoflavonifractor sp. TaxID=1221379 RepID=UPI0025FAE1FF|nr:TetR-like C-terminal domain-containing protein [uncultured Pseudoflavonifractor sp.]
MEAKQGSGRDDRRVRRTKQMLRSALLELLREKSVDQITVTELTQKADVNRGTFYGHYKDIYDMVEQMENEMFQEFSDLLHAYPADALRHGLRPILQDVFAFLQRYGDVAAALLERDRDTRFLEKLKGMVAERVSLEWGRLYQFSTPKEQAFCLSFLVGGAVGLIQSWLEGGRKESPEELAALSEAMILRGIEGLNQPR